MNSDETPIDPYIYPGTKVLINLLDERDQASLNAIETDLVAERITELRERPIDGQFDQSHLKAIHHHLFQDVYPTYGQSKHPFSGEIRTIGIRKDNGISYPHPSDLPIHNLQARLDYAFNELKSDNLLEEKDKETFVSKLTKHTAEVWECHPFRDGNTRTTFVISEQLARIAGFEYAKDPELERRFRETIADYARGQRTEFESLISKMVVDRKTGK